MNGPVAVDYALIFNASSNAMAFTDLATGCILDVNATWERSVGIARDKALGQTALSLGVWRDAQARSACSEALRTSGHVSDFEAELILQSGPQPHLISAQVIRTREGDYVLWEFRDISELKRKDRALQEFSRDFETFLDQTTDFIYFKDLNGRFRFCSQTQATVTGHAHWRDMRGKTVADVAPAHLAAIYMADEKKVLEGRQSIVDQVNPYVAADGKPGFTLTSRWPLFDQQGHVAGIFGISRDITERMRTEAALRASELKYRALAQNAPLAIQVFSPMGEPLRVNPAWERLWGVTFADLRGYNVLRDPQLEATGMLSLLRRAFVGETVKFPVHRYERAGVEAVPAGAGEALWLQAYAYPVSTDDGELLEVVVVQEDVTVAVAAVEAQKLQQQTLEQTVLQRTQELHDALRASQVASRAKGAFLANMSHEIRTPLNAITGMAHLIRRAGLTDKQMAQMGKLEKASEHLLGTINAILDLSKIEAGKFTLEVTPIQVETLVGNVLSMLQERAREKGLQLSSAMDALPRGLQGDGTRLQQCLLNYATNAVKFTEHGSVTLRVRLLEDGPGSALLRFEVEDTGIGVEDEALPRLFMAFEQADNSTTRKYGGTGLGLAITHKLAHLMGGDAAAEQRPAGGSLFWFTALLQKSSAGTDMPAMQDSADVEAQLKRLCQGRRILLAEDEPVNQEIARIVLEEVGLQVDVADNGAQALKMASGGAYDLVLMDVQMPVMDGLSATVALRRLPQCAALPILAMTANAFAEDKVRCLEAGMNDFITKPVVPAALFATLLHWLARPA